MTGRELRRLYNIWKQMRNRCANQRNVAYPRYGGRGIKVCQRWRSFDAFLADMGPRPSRRHSIDRFPDNDDDYKPSNCRWATRSQQARNCRNSRIVTHLGLTRSIADWADEYGIQVATLAARLRRVSPEEAFAKRLYTRYINQAEQSDLRVPLSQSTFPHDE